MAAEDAEDEGVTVKTVIANDDVPSAPKGQEDERRGVAGEVIMWKVGGAAAAKGWELDEVIRVAQKAVDNTRSIGIGLTPCVIPSVGKANFSIEPGKMEFGIGHHGEPGIKVTDLTTADEMAEMSLETILPDLPFEKGDEVVVLVSGLGATPLMELYIFYNRVEEILTGEWNMKIHRPYVGEYFTSLDMMGVTLTVMKVDEELKELMDTECYSMGLKQWAI
jgi:dihydroxyacetone kinase-like protein